MIYKVFRRTWWKENRNGTWPNGLEPCPGKRRYVRGQEFETKAEARAFCQGLNAGDGNISAKDKRLGLKYEYEGF